MDIIDELERIKSKVAFMSDMLALVFETEGKPKTAFGLSLVFSDMENSLGNLQDDITN